MLVRPLVLGLLPLLFALSACGDDVESSSAPGAGGTGGTSGTGGAGGVAGGAGGTGGSTGGEDVFGLDISNTAPAMSLPGGENVMIAPGLWIVHQPGWQSFELGSGASQALETLAEKGDASLLGATLDQDPQVLAWGPFGADDVGAGTYAENPILPGVTVSSGFKAPSGARLSLIGMWIQSNDWFVATPPEGVSLHDINGQAMSVSTSLGLWDAGTEADEEPGAGPNQAPRQSNEDAGDPDPDTAVRAASVSESSVSVIITPQ